MNISHNYHLKYSFFILFICAFLMSCNGDGNSEVQNQSATLTFNVSGLPTTVPANISVSGPNNFSETITSTTTFTDLAAGSYQVNSQAVTDSVFQYSSDPELQTLSIVSGQSRNVEVIYSVENSLIEGEITGFGSVFVNGIELDTNNSVISTDDSDDVSESMLGVGMPVRVIAKLA